MTEALSRRRDRWTPTLSSGPMSAIGTKLPIRDIRFSVA
jgi:hypothetical protein